MSSFKENFERGDREQLDYDDAAFYYFSIVMLLVAVIPGTYYLIISPMIFGTSGINYRLKNCKCTVCKDRMKNREAIYSMSWLNKWFVAKFIVLAYLWYVTYSCYDTVKDLK